MKRHGCIDCKLMEPVAGQWIGGLCPVCTKMRTEREARQAAPIEAPKPVNVEEELETVPTIHPVR